MNAVRLKPNLKKRSTYLDFVTVLCYAHCSYITRVTRDRVYEVDCAIREVDIIDKVTPIECNEIEPNSAPTFLSDVLTPETILEHPRLLLRAGVGAGKNTFFENAFPDKKVLILTSRRAKADEGNESAADKENVLYETYHKFASDWKQNKEQTWDILVCDEVHALVTDSTFANDMITIFDYFEQYEENRRTEEEPVECVVFMTATPQPIEKYCERHDFYTIDLFTKCRNLTPEKIIITTQDDFLQQRGNVPFSYYATQKKVFKNLLSVLYSKYGKCNIQTYTAGSPCNVKNLSDEVFTTSVYREGVNFYNDETAIVAVESHDPLEMYQFAGRFRGSVKELWVIYDAPQNHTVVSDQKKNLAFLLTQADPCLTESLDDKFILTTTDGMAYRSCSTGQVKYNDVKLEAIRRYEDVLKSFKNYADEVVRRYFGSDVDVEWRQMLCLDRKFRSKLLKEVSYDNMKDFEIRLKKELEGRNVGTTSDGTYRVSRNDLAEIVELSKEYNIVNSDKVSYRNGVRLLQAFNYIVEKKADRHKNRKSNNYVIVKRIRDTALAMPV